MADVSPAAVESLQRSMRQMFWQTYGRKATEATLNPVDPEGDRIKITGMTMATVRDYALNSVTMIVKFEAAEDVEDDKPRPPEEATG